MQTEQTLKEQALECLQSDLEYAFKGKVTVILKQIAENQNKISALLADIQKLKISLKELKLEPLNLSLD